MIFVTVGTQLPFDRLVAAVDAWAGSNPGVEVFAQIGPTKNPPRNLSHADFLPPARADELMQGCDLIVAHAGMGSILSALKYQRPIVILPRRFKLREHRNDHQYATAKWLANRPGVFVAWNESDVGTLLDRRESFSTGPSLGPFADGPLVERLRNYIAGER